MKITFIIIFLHLSLVLLSQERIEFRGIERTGHYNETGLLKVWPEKGPELILKIEGVGKGFSQPIFVDGIIFISGIKEDTTDILSSYNLKEK